MKYTSAEAVKLLRKLNEAQAALMEREAMSSVFSASLGEDVESVRPEYDYRDVQNQLKELEEKIRRVRHAINEFNLHTIVPEFDMTIDQILIYIPQLTARKRKLSCMRSRLPKQREAVSGMRGAAIVDYSYANYDIREAEADYWETVDELAKAQTALDVVNNTLTMEIDL